MADTDPHLLEGISPERLAGLFKLFQSGQFQTPSSPALPAAPSAVMQRPQQSAPSSAAQPAHFPAVGASNAVAEITDNNKEDGEVSDMDADGEEASALLRAPPTGPKADRNNLNPQSNGAPLSRQSSHQAPPSQANSYVNGRNRTRNAEPVPTPQTSKRPHSPDTQLESHKRRELQMSLPQRPKSLASKKDDSKGFISILVNNGSSFEDVVLMAPRHRQQLRALFIEMGLPVIAAENRSVAEGPSPPVAEAKAPVKRLATHKPAPPARDVYLARLQAARNKKPEVTARPNNAQQAQQPRATPSEQRNERPPAPVLRQDEQIAIASSAPISSRPASTDSEKAKAAKDKNDLLREKLAALKARQIPPSSAALRTDMVASSSLRARQQAVQQPKRYDLPPEKAFEIDFAMGAAFQTLREQNAAAATRNAAKTQPLTYPVAPIQPPPACVQTEEAKTRPASGSHTTQPPLPVQPTFNPPAIPPTPSRSFTGLPGLFMGGAPAQSIPAPPSVTRPAATVPPPGAPVDPTNIPSLLLPKATPAAPAPIDQHDKEHTVPISVPMQLLPAIVSSKVPSRTGSRNVNNLFGQSRSESQNEALIIEVSSDEESDDETATHHIPFDRNPKQTGGFPLQPGPYQILGSLPGLQRTATGGSTPGTPGNSMAAEQLRQKQAQLAKDKLELERSIAEMEQRKTKAKVIFGMPSTPAFQPAAVEATTSNSTPAVEANGGTNRSTATTVALTGLPQSSGTHKLSEREAADIEEDTEDLYGEDETPDDVAPVTIQPDTTTNVDTKKPEVDADDDMQDVYEPAKTLKPPSASDRQVDSQATTASVSSIAATTDDQAIEPPNAVSQELDKTAQDSGKPFAAQNASEDGEINEKNDEPEAEAEISLTGQDVVDRDDVGYDGYMEMNSSDVSSENLKLEGQGQAKDDAGQPLIGSAAADMNVADGERNVDTPSVISEELDLQAESENKQDAQLDGVPATDPDAADDADISMEENEIDIPSTSDEEDSEAVPGVHAGLPITHPEAPDDKYVYEDGEIDTSSSEEEMLDLYDRRVDNEPNKHASFGGADEDDDSGEDVDGFVYSPAKAESEKKLAVLVESTNTTNDADVAPELQLSDEQQVMAREEVEPTSAEPPAFFTPYQSPLTMFKGYKNHAQYLQSVSGGFKSLTYSNKIKPNQAVCPIEARGVECTVRACEYQHFNAMQLSDSELLKELGTTGIPTKTSEDTRRWNEGMKGLVGELRRQNLGKDAEEVSAAIQLFRRRYVADDSKVLNLGL